MSEGYVLPCGNGRVLGGLALTLMATSLKRKRSAIDPLDRRIGLNLVRPQTRVVVRRSSAQCQTLFLVFCFGDRPRKNKKQRLTESAGINRHGVANERVAQGRSSAPP